MSDTRCLAKKVASRALHTKFQYINVDSGLDKARGGPRLAEDHIFLCVEVYVTIFQSPDKYSYPG